MADPYWPALEQLYNPQPWAYDARYRPASMEAQAQLQREKDLASYDKVMGLRSRLADLESKVYQPQHQAATLTETMRHNRAMEANRAPPDLYDIRQDDAGNYFYIPKTPGSNLPTIPVPSPAGAQLRRAPSLPEKMGTELREAGSTAQRALAQQESFRNQFGGSFVLGDVENWAKRMFPILEHLDDSRGQADWWSAMQEMDTLIRHPLFGSALTPTEQALWRQTTVGPRDDPAFIKINLARRAALLNTAVARMTRSASGRYRREEVLNQTGLPDIPAEEFAAPIVSHKDLERRQAMMRRMWQPQGMRPDTGGGDDAYRQALLDAIRRAAAARQGR